MKLFLAMIFAFVLLFSGCTQTPQSAPEQTSAEPSPAAPIPQPPAPSVLPNTTANVPAPDLPADAPPAIPVQEPSVPALPPADETPAAPEPVIVRGTIDPDFEVTVYNKSAALFGTTIFPDNHISGKPRIVEVNMLGEVLWEYVLPSEWSSYTNPGFDVEPLANGNVLFLLPRKGVFEVNRDKKIVWSYYDSKVSHDADRLANGNTLIGYGAYDSQSDAQAKEVTPAGKVVWSYYAKNDYAKPPYSSISDEGWTHTNAVTRLPNGNTWVNFRNFNILAEVSPAGKLVRAINNSEFYYQHDPELQPNGNILLANHATPNTILETDSNGAVLWRYVIKEKSAWPARDANRLSNGNTLVTGTGMIFEITPSGEKVWELKLKNVQFTQQTAPALGFFKAERIVE